MDKHLKTTDKPTLQDFHIDGVKHINPSDALDALIDGDAVMIDVRELSEVKLGIVPLDHVVNHPMSLIFERMPYIMKAQNIIVACPGGVRSAKVASLLVQNGYESVASLDGGLMTWKAKGLPYESILPGAYDSGKNTNVTLLKSETVKNKANNIDFKNLRMI